MILNKNLRPLVIFNPANKEHRQHYNNFLTSGTWSSCPVRFAVEDERSNNNLAYAMQRVLVEYYMSSEFQNS